MSGMQPYGRLARCAGWMLLVCLVVGCSAGDSASLSGKVTYDGKAIPDGSIRLQPMGDAVGQGVTAKIVDGKYEISEGLFAGEYRVMVSAMRPATPAEIAAMKRADAEDRESEDEGEEPDQDPGEETTVGDAPSQPMTSYLPAKHGHGSKLTVKLEAGENTKDFDLER